ncbi:MAG: tRNA (adenosine(37)-N6)-threonylcarbamoyltransferase complex ATPase subunit type 1 TsaE [Candidatus Latescibacterota bacterium]|nr:tRNA (adenosine(37)-N6)-threonylcarbamoyltransferase complex ATPase subunit type 1 TsaE [Candidatus Latescibacterota bacterium]
MGTEDDAPWQEQLSHTPEQTQSLAQQLAQDLSPGDLVAVEGEIGAGKTCFIQGVCAELGVTDPVQSPTFVLIHEYEGRFRDHEVVHIRHFDFYRLSSVDELEVIGVSEFFHDADGLCLVEWAERAGGLLPQRRWEVCLEHVRGENDQRRVRWRHLTTVASRNQSRGNE